MEIDVVGPPTGIQPGAASAIVRPEEEPQVTERLDRPADGEDDEEDVCRICRTPGNDESPLYYPCACSGSIKYVHQDCLLQWLNHSNARQCEVCKHAFAFSPIYAENAPARLPFQELLLGLAIKAGGGCKFFLRLTFVLSVWLLFIPFTTFWIWRLTFVRSITDAQKLFFSRLSPSLLLADCLHGFLLSAGIVFIFLGATSLREYFRHLRELAGQDDREDDAVDRQLGARAGRRIGHGFGRIVPLDAAGQAQAARLEAQVEQIFDAVEDGDGAEDVPFDELVGMQGPVFHLVENAITVLASNAIFLGLVALLPFTLGRVVLSLASRLVVGSSIVGTKLFSNTTVGSSLAVNITSELAKVETGMVAASSDESSNAFLSMVVGDGLAGSGAAVMGTAIETVTEAMVTKLQLSDAGTVAVGYGIIALAMGLYLGFVALVRYGRGEPLTVARIHGVASMAEAAPSVARQMMAGLMYVATMVKVAFLLVIELGWFPLLCGWWLDICTLGMLEVTIAQRVAFFWTAPLTSSILHWLVGIVYMLQISIFVSLLREVLRPGVLYFLRDPADPNYNPFRDLIDDPIHKHARRVLLSVVVYGSLIVMLVFLPVQLAVVSARSLFPLDLRFSDPFTEIPADMLLFHICIPFAVEHFRPRATIKAVLHHWFSAVGWVLGLCEFLLPGPEDANRPGNGVHHDANPHVEHPGGAPEAAPGAAVQNASEHDPLLTSRESDGDMMAEEEVGTEEYRFAVRIVLLLLGAWVTLLVFNSSMIVLPIALGRAIFASVSRLPMTRGAKCNDLYAFNIGCYVLWAVAAAVRYAVDYLKTHDVKVLMLQILKWSAIVAKSTVLLTLWIIVIPVLIGVLFDVLVVVPLRVPINESPVFFYYQDWALGLVFLKIWTRLVMLGGQIRPLWDDNWRLKFEQVKADGFARLRGFWVLKEIIGPILFKLLVALVVPYGIAHHLFPLLGFRHEVNDAVIRFAWLGCLALVSGWYATKRLHLWILDLHNSIRDDRYLVGRRLHNFGEKRVADPTDLSSPDTMADGGIDGDQGPVDGEVPSDGTALLETAASVSNFTAGNLSLGYVRGGVGTQGKRAVGGEATFGSEFQQEAADRKFGVTGATLRLRTAASGASASSSTSSNSVPGSQDQ